MRAARESVGDKFGDFVEAFKERLKLMPWALATRILTPEWQATLRQRQEEQQDLCKLGDSVVVQGGAKGTVKYIGPTDGYGAGCTWIGLAMDDPIGDATGEPFFKVAYSS